MNPNMKWVYGAFAVLALLLWITVSKATAVILGWTGLADMALVGSQFTVSTLVGLLTAGAAAYAVIRSPRALEIGGEVVAELKRVTWPERQETFAATIIVIVTVFIISLILGIFDLVWSRLTNFIYQ
jgi:preprotein translocase subunit SecE